ncbi:MAG: adenosylcobinamide-GDP ribazoletransferase [Eubacteriales bacterium]|nr:adenosylcobinamide-GDP ribazoletransferase [Eubacteriales bacterium]
MNREINVLIKGFKMAFSSFTIFSFPHKVWDDNARIYMLLFFPIVGLWIGILFYFFNIACSFFGVPIFIRALICSIFFSLSSGFIHVDGFMDVCDAILSRSDSNKKQQILKDSHVGSFSVVATIILFLTNYASFTNIKRGVDIMCIILIPVVSRIMSAIQIINRKSMYNSQYNIVYINSKTKKYSIVSFILFLFLIASIILESILFGPFVYILYIEILIHFISCALATKSLNGMNGDISGFAISVCECVAILIFTYITINGGII